MKKQNPILVLALLLSSCIFVNAQERTQTIKGTVVDKEAQITLPGANIIILETDPLMGTITNPEGVFRIENVPVGRTKPFHNFTLFANRLHFGII